MKRTVLITGASSGIGKALAEKYLAEGCQVYGTNRSGNIEGLKHDNLVVFKLDLAKQEHIDQLAKLFSERKLGIDLLINNAGIGPDLGFEKPESDSFQKTFSVNTVGTTFFTEAMLAHLNKDAKVINISSKMGSIAACIRTGSIAYCMSKSALNMYSKLLGNRLEGKHKVATIHPGWVRTNISPGSDQAPLSPEQSAVGIFDFVESDFESGAFWDVEAQEFCEW